MYVRVCRWLCTCAPVHLPAVVGRVHVITAPCEQCSMSWDEWQSHLEHCDRLAMEDSSNGTSTALWCHTPHKSANNFAHPLVDFCQFPCPYICPCQKWRKGHQVCWAAQSTPTPARATKGPQWASGVLTRADVAPRAYACVALRRHAHAQVHAVCCMAGGAVLGIQRLHQHPPLLHVDAASVRRT